MCSRDEEACSTEYSRGKCDKIQRIGSLYGLDNHMFPSFDTLEQSACIKKLKTKQTTGLQSLCNNNNREKTTQVFYLTDKIPRI